MLINCILAFITTLLFVYFATRKIIVISFRKHLFDNPTEERKVHLTKTPNLGGAVIFIAILFSSSLFLPFPMITHLNTIVACSLLLFILGMTDDLIGVDPIKKIVAQLGIALLITIHGDFRFTGFDFLPGLSEFSYSVSIILSTLFIILVINAFNLIDGIDCLAASISLLAFTVFSIIFWLTHDYGYLVLTIGMCGCLCSFIYYNMSPARVFMGDTGALFIGFLISICSIHFMELSKGAPQTAAVVFGSPSAIIASLLLIPVFDTLRIFIVRLIQNKSPFRADRNHIHHRLLKLDLSHMKVTSILLLFNIGFILFTVLFLDLGSGTLIISLIILCLLLNASLTYFVNLRAKSRKNEDFRRSQLNSTGIFSKTSNYIVNEVPDPVNKAS